MTISAVVPDIAFAGSSSPGTLGPFSLVKSGTPIVFYANSEVYVYRYDAVTDTAPTLLVEGTDYTLTGGPTAGSITLTSPQTGLLTAERLYVYTRTSIAQALDLVNGGNFSSSNLERRLDIIFQIIQQLDREVKSGIRFAMFDTDEIPKTLPLGAAIDKVPYVTGTASAPTVAYLDAEVLADLSELSVENLANIALVAADLSSADTIGIVAAAIDDVGDVADNINAITEVADWIGGDGELFTFIDVTSAPYNAAGNGTTDDTAAIQAAITAANATTHKRLYFPAGTYKYTAQLLWHNGVEWFGDGPTKSIIKLDSSAGNIVGIRTNTTSNVANAKSVTSITSSSTTATVTTSAAHGYTTGDFINIIGATQVEYNGSFEITVTGSTTFTYTFRGSATTPATGTITCTPKAYMQSNITMRGLGFQGFNQVLTTTPGESHNAMIRAYSIDGLLIENCKFWDHKAFPISFGGVKNLRVTDTEFTSFGREPANWNDGTLPALDGGGAWWMSANPIDNTPTEDVLFLRPNVHDGDAAAYFIGKNVKCSFGRFRNLKEGLYNRRLELGGESFDTENFEFIGNHVKGVTSTWVQAAGLELGAKTAKIHFNTFEDCEGAGLDITDTCEDVDAFGNAYINCATHTGTTPDGTSTINNAGSIWIRATSATAVAPTGIRIRNERIRSPNGNYGIRIQRLSGSETFSNIQITDCDLDDAASSSGNNLVYTSAHFGSDVVIKDNIGASDYVPATTTWTPTVTPSSGAITTYTTPQAVYWRNGPAVFFSLSIVVSDNGTGSGLLRFTLPSTPARAGYCGGVNTVTGIGNVWSWASSSATVTGNTAAGAYPVATGQTLRISGFYLEA